MKKSIRIELPEDRLEVLKMMASESEFDSIEAMFVAIAQTFIDTYEMTGEQYDQACEKNEEPWSEEALAYDEAVRKFCVQHFFKDPRYLVDMSRYRDMIANAGGIDLAVKIGLAKYLDERKILSKIYLEVRDHFKTASRKASFFMCESSGPLPENLPEFPTLASLDVQFELELADVYRRADVTVAKRLEQATKHA